MNIESQITNAAQQAVKALYGQEVPEKMVQLQKTRSEFEGNLTLVVFPFLKISKKNPEQTAQEIGQYLVDNCEAIAAFNVVKGFLNLVIAPAAWLSLLADMDADEHYGEKQATNESPLVMIEYSSPNTNKPLHLGHVRNNLLGWSLAQIMQANGNKVVKTNIVNDRGIHICKSMLAWLKWGNGETPDKKGDHYVGDLYVLFNKKLKEQEKRFLNNWKSSVVPYNLGGRIKIVSFLRERYNFYAKKENTNNLWCSFYKMLLSKMTDDEEFEIDKIKYQKALRIVAKRIKRNWRNKEYRFEDDYSYGMLKIFSDFVDLYTAYINKNYSHVDLKETIAIICLIERRISNQIEESLLYNAQKMLVKWEQNDPEVRALWEKMNNWVYAGFDETYKMMGVSFDKIYYESQTYLKGKAKVEEGLAKGLFERHEDGSVWADLTDEGLDKKLLLRSDGTSVYMTQDIGTAEMRFQDYPIDKMIYVVGNEQNYHFQVLSILLDRLGFKWGKELVHFSYGMVELPNGKMKSREGTVVDADDLMQLMIDDALKTSLELGKFADMGEEERNEIARIVGMGALKYFILKVDARKNMLFNPEESIDFNGNTGPFIQYTYARIRSILRKAQNIPSTLNTPNILNEKEVELIQKMSEYGAAVEQAGKDYSPSGIANYCYELTKVFNQFYHDYSILNEEDEQKRQVRLVIARNVGKIIRNGMALLGIEVPERM